MREILFDADAFLCVRSLSLMTALDVDGCQWLMTEIVARRELSSVARELADFEASKRLLVKSVASRGTPQADTFKELCRAGHDRGEAESIAWACHLEPDKRPLFISNDLRARRLAADRRVPVGDVMDLIVEAIGATILDEKRAESITTVWGDRRKDLCRPRDFTTFSELLKKRRGGRS